MTKEDLMKTIKKGYEEKFDFLKIEFKTDKDKTYYQEINLKEKSEKELIKYFDLKYTYYLMNFNKDENTKIVKSILKKKDELII